MIMSWIQEQQENNKTVSEATCQDERKKEAQQAVCHIF